MRASNEFLALCSTQDTYLEVVMKRHNVPMAFGHAFEDRYFVPDLQATINVNSVNVRALIVIIGHHIAHHVLSAFHELFIDDLAGIVFAGLDMDGFLHNSIRPAAEGLTSAILLEAAIRIARDKTIDQDHYIALTWHGTVVVAVICCDGLLWVVVEGC